MRGLPIDHFPEQAYDVVHDKFHGEYTDATPQLDGWTPVFGAGTLTSADRALTIEEPSHLVFTGTAVDDQFHALWRTYEEFKFHPSRPIRFRTDFPAGAADQNNDQQSMFTGCLEGADGANDLLDAGAGPILDADKFGFYKCGTTGAAVLVPNYIHCVSSFGANQQITQLNAANPANLSGVDWKQHDAATIFRNKLSLIAEWRPTNMVPGVAGAAPTILDAEVNFWINGIHVCKHVMNGTYQITAATAEAMNYGYVSRTQAAEIIVNTISFMRCTQLPR